MVNKERKSRDIAENIDCGPSCEALLRTSVILTKSTTTCRALAAPRDSRLDVTSESGTRRVRWHLLHHEVCDSCRQDSNSREGELLPAHSH